MTLPSAPLTMLVAALTSLSAAAANFPDAGLWQPVAINAPDGGVENLGAPLGDGSNNGRDIVGDNLRPLMRTQPSTGGGPSSLAASKVSRQEPPSLVRLTSEGCDIGQNANAVPRCPPQQEARAPDAAFG